MRPFSLLIVILAIHLIHPTTFANPEKITALPLNGTDKLTKLGKERLTDPLRGVIINRTVTVQGHEFYRFFSMSWHELDENNQYSITVYERPSARWGSEVWVEHHQNRVFHTFLPPARSKTKGISQQAAASELIYYPLNPSFGGSPLNGQVLLNSALATNKHKDTSYEDNYYGYQEPSAIDQFNDSLERSIISRLATSASSKIMDAEGNFIPGFLETQNFSIEIKDTGSGLLSITTTDILSGSTTIFEVSKR